MPMLRTCSAPGCTTLTLSELCLAHEPLRPAAATADLASPHAGTGVLPVVVTAVAAAGAGLLAGSRLSRRPHAGAR